MDLSRVAKGETCKPLWPRATTLTHPRVRAYVDQSRLVALATTRCHAMNKGLVNAILEKWHYETSSFHLSVGKMTNTLNDMS